MIRQSINLHQLHARRLDPLSPAALACVLGGLLLVAGLLSAWLAWQTVTSERATDDLAGMVRSLESDLERMRAQLPADKADDALVAGVAERERRLARGERLLAGLNERISEPPAGFSLVLNSLAREPLEGVWLERIVIGSGGGLLFEGQAIDGDRIPRFVERLGREPELIGREFRTLRIERDGTDARAVKFSLVGVGVSDEPVR